MAIQTGKPTRLCTVRWLAVVSGVGVMLANAGVFAQDLHSGDLQRAGCKPVSERTSEVGCWIIAHAAFGKLSMLGPYWYLDTYPTRQAAESAKGPHSTVIESFGKIRLLSIERAGWRPAGGERVAEIGPLPVMQGEE